MPNDRFAADAPLCDPRQKGIKPWAPAVLMIRIDSQADKKKMCGGRRGDSLSLVGNPEFGQCKRERIAVDISRYRHPFS